jgi:hypothetical protein
VVFYLFSIQGGVMLEFGKVNFEYFYFIFLPSFFLLDFYLEITLSYAHNLIVSNLPMSAQLSKKYPSLPSAIDFHRPLVIIGSSLNNVQQTKLTFLLQQFEIYTEEPSTPSYSSPILNLLLDEVTYCIRIGSPYDEILPELIRFLRINITSSQLNNVKKATKLCDMLVKNCGRDIHKLVGRRYFMKTIALVARRHMSKRTPRNQDMGIFLLDTIQVRTAQLCCKQEK